MCSAGSEMRQADKRAGAGCQRRCSGCASAVKKEEPPRHSLSPPAEWTAGHEAEREKAAASAHLRESGVVKCGSMKRSFSTRFE